jgi:4-hydroxybenzoate polyprenyltransferase
MKNILSESPSLEIHPPLFIDLDGTLIKSDLLVESFILLIKRNPLIIFKIPFWLLRGKAHLKSKIAERIHIDPAHLPFHSGFLSFLHEEAARGRELILASASNVIPANQVADHLGIFRKVLASDDTLNLAGKKKLKAILETCNNGEFDYAGNASTDLVIWAHCRKAILVNPGRGIEKTIRKKANIQEIFEERITSPSPYLRLIRAHHWMKNLLLFVPLMTSHNWDDLSSIFNLTIGFFSFSFCASGGYIFNDFLDLQSDRNHPRKCRRPLAACDISLVGAGILMILLFSIGLVIAGFLSMKFLGILLLYVIFSLAYSFWLKTIVLIDVLTLAGLYALRVIAGAFLIDVYLSFWLLTFSIFIFFSLALVKRCSELHTISKTNSSSTKGRDYHAYDLDYLQNMGIASGYLSVIVLALYINSNEVTIHYSQPKFLWVLCPAILYWISRVWLKTGRGEMNDDPLVYAIRDRVSWAVGVICVVSVIMAI